MKKLILFMKRKPGTSVEQFRRHYEHVHLPLNAKWIGHLVADFRRYYPENLENFFRGAERGGSADVAGGCSYDAVSIYTLRDGSAFDELMKVAQNIDYQRAIAADEAEFCDRAAGRGGVTDEFSGGGLNGS